MKISESLQQLARYNIQQRKTTGQVDIASEKLKRFNTILDMFAADGNEREPETKLAALELMSTPAPSLYGRMLQALSAELARDRIPFPQAGPDAVEPAASVVKAGEAAHNSPAAHEPNEPLSEPEQINLSVARAASRYNLPENLIKAVIKAESANNPRAVSPAGAQGLMQLMPGTARELGVTDAFDIDQNIDGGARYLRQMIDRYRGDVPRALAAYNAGPGTVDRYRGNVPYRETIAYVDRVLRYSQQV